MRLSFSSTWSSVYLGHLQYFLCRRTQRDSQWYRFKKRILCYSFWS